MDNAKKHYVYTLRCADGTYYTGYTTNIEQRINKHERGLGAKYTRGRGPFQLVFTKEFPTKTEAMRAEYRIKKMPRYKKEQFFVLENRKG
nr:GIY-YIG nuclease family protein [Bacillus piscicola]